MLAIRNFGHFWSRDLVNWGRPNSAGDLMGYQMFNRQPWIVNFRDQIGIYILFTLQREVIYIGQTGAGDQRLFLRLRQHTNSELRDRWTNFSWFGFRGVNNTSELSDMQKPESRCSGSHIQALDETESVLLQILEPRLNKQGPRWGEETQQFLQYVPWEWSDEVEKPLSHETRKLTNQLQELESKVDLLVKKAK